MSLGVLNNLSAMYASNNLNNTQNSLTKTLQELSSGSKINSGADDAAGLSLVNGLQANSQALTQSKTNAQEGVGLLQVADGALSQVTNLLNRAVTLATEVSNGTLNSSQQSAANQEYQSILSEINNIGSTTTYNQKSVFGTVTNIYASDSSSAGSSINSLNIRSLSSANVGDSGGTMSYSTGQSNVFINMSNLAGTTNAQVTDSLTNATSTLTVEYLTKGANGYTTANTTISVGAGTNFDNTVGGMINAINSANLGVTASFGTAKQAGDAAVGAAMLAGAANASVGGAETGIIISGGAIAAGAGGQSGTNPSGVSTTGLVGFGTSGTSGVASHSALNLSGTLTINGVSINLGKTSAQNAGNIGSAGAAVNAETDSLDSLVATINANNGAGYGLQGVNAAVTENSDGTFSLSLSQKAEVGSGNAPDTVLTVSASGALYSGTAMSYLAGSSYNTGFTNSTVQSQGQAGSRAAVTDLNGSGTAMISYADAAGQDLSASDLSSQGHAQSALNALNSAISAVSAQDGYIGAQINTLNAVSSVLSTQQQNVVAAQNAVQATDYATAASNMSKYQILSQTGISALAQANSMQQEVTKLLQ